MKWNLHAALTSTTQSRITKSRATTMYPVKLNFNHAMAVDSVLSVHCASGVCISRNIRVISQLYRREWKSQRKSDHTRRSAFERSTILTSPRKSKRAAISPSRAFHGAQHPIASRKPLRQDARLRVRLCAPREKGRKEKKNKTRWTRTERGGNNPPLCSREICMPALICIRCQVNLHRYRAKMGTYHLPWYNENAKRRRILC